MTTFEIIILIIIYFFGLGYVIQIFRKEDNIYWRVFFVTLSLVIAIYFPLFLAEDLYKKLNNKEDEK